jgi:hypothetical protein
MSALLLAVAGTAMMIHEYWQRLKIEHSSG